MHRSLGENFFVGDWDNAKGVGLLVVSPHLGVFSENASLTERSYYLRPAVGNVIGGGELDIEFFIAGAEFPAFNVKQAKDIFF